MTKKAELYRMMTGDHICPFGIKAKDLLAREGYEVVDHPLSSAEETEAFRDWSSISVKRRSSRKAPPISRLSLSLVQPS